MIKETKQKKGNNKENKPISRKTRKLIDGIIESEKIMNKK